MKKALCVGIDRYPNAPLHCCGNDAQSMYELLSFNQDRTPNFSVKCLFNEQATKKNIMTGIRELFSNQADVALLYFAGHGSMYNSGNYIVTVDYEQGNEGISMSDILNVINTAPVTNKIIIFDCCFSGDVGTMHNCGSEASSICPGTTILTASRSNETSKEVNDHGVFTNLLCAALGGGAADLLGRITPGSLYSYVDQALGPWEQRPVFKTNVSQFITIRKVTPPIAIESLHKLIVYFKQPKDIYPLDPSYEPAEKNVCQKEHTDILAELQKLVKVGLVVPVKEEHMYYAAINSTGCRLTPLGQHYWYLVKDHRI